MSAPDTQLSDAVERLRAWSKDLHNESAIFADLRTVLAELERLTKENEWLGLCFERQGAALRPSPRFTKEDVTEMRRVAEQVDDGNFLDDDDPESPGEAAAKLLYDLAARISRSLAPQEQK